MIRPLESREADAVAGMTFPAYRHLLALHPTPRHPGEGDRRLVQPVARTACRGGCPIGLALAELPLAGGEGSPELLSVYVTPEWRNRGIGTELVGAIEAAAWAGGHARIQAVYVTGKPSIPAFERVLATRAWSPPAARAVITRFTPASAATLPWFGRVRLSSEFEVFPWTALRAGERDDLVRTHQQSGWIREGLEPWRHDWYGFDPISSIGLRHRGRVVGWVINHRLSPDWVRFTCSFVRRDLAARGRILPLYTESIRRLAAHGPVECTIVTPLAYREMTAFLRRRCREAVRFGESRSSEKVRAAGDSR